MVSIDVTAASTTSETEEVIAPPPPPAPPPARPKRLERLCAGCGYGAVSDHPPEWCPMCGGEAWDFAPWRPFGR